MSGEDKARKPVYHKKTGVKKQRWGNSKRTEEGYFMQTVICLSSPGICLSSFTLPLLPNSNVLTIFLPQKFKRANRSYSKPMALLLFVKA